MAAQFIFRSVPFGVLDFLLVSGLVLLGLIFIGERVDEFHDESGSDGFHQHACSAGLLIGWHGQAVLESLANRHHC